MKKPLLVIYINNTVAFLLYKLNKKLLKINKSQKNGMLFINHGNLGDVLISTVLLENENLFPQGLPLYLMVKHEFEPLFKEYKGRFKLIFWNYKKYKYSFSYRLLFLKKLRQLGVKTTYNLTSARGVTSDDVALLSGAEKIYCINSRWKYLRKIFAQKLNAEYDGVLFSDFINEYHKHISLLKSLTENVEVTVSNINSVLLSHYDSEVRNVNKLNEKYIVLAPFASDCERSWGLTNYRQLAISLSKKNQIVIVGAPTEKNIAEKYFSAIENCINLTGKIQILDVLKIIRGAKLFIGNDSGLTHAALKFNVPIVAVIGGGNYGMYFPFEPSSNRIFLADEMDCFGCEWNCIHPKRFCLTNVSVEAVIQAAQTILNKR